MVLCELRLSNDFLPTYFLLTVIAIVTLFATSGTIFRMYYSNPTYEQWTRKSNPKFPSPEMVRMEITQMMKGVFTATLCPSLSLWLAQYGYSHAYCGVNKDYGITYDIVSFFAIWVASDLWEWGYHYLGHTTEFGWKQHRHHHKFYNPSPFAVIADEYFDQFWRSAPMLVFPMLVPLNIDVLFFEFALFFYFYGTYLHWGYEFDAVSAHNPVLNTAFQHYIHHAKSTKGKAYHCGFFFKLWDNLAGSVYPKDRTCECVKCARDRGERSRELWDKTHKPDYSVLMQPSFWLSPVETSKKAA